MKFTKLRKCIQTAILLIILSLLWGCGSGGDQINTTTSKSFNNGASVSIVPSGEGDYVIQGDKLVDVGGMDLKISYDSTTLLSPTVTKGDLISGAILVSNTNVPGTIKIALVSVKPITGSGQIASISFATHIGPANITLDSVTMADFRGHMIQ